MTQAEYALTTASQYSPMDAPGFRRLASWAHVEIVYFEDGSELHLYPDDMGAEPLVLKPPIQKQSGVN